MSNSIQQALSRIFKKHRIVIWYDEEGKLQPEFEAIDLADVSDVQMDHNPFFVKYKVMREEPEQKFLLYAPYARPAQAENWLLDLELAHYLFHTDEASLFLQDLGWEGHFKELVEAHLPFFQSKERRSALKKLTRPEDRHDDLRRKMLAVTFGAYEPTLDACLLEYARAFNEEAHGELEHELDRFDLADIFWSMVKRQYAYQAEQPGIYDFLLACFRANTPYLSEDDPGVNRDSRILLQKWPEMARSQDAYRSISRRIAEDLNIERKLETATTEQLAEDELYQVADEALLRRLGEQVRTGEIDTKRLMPIIRRRQKQLWFAEHVTMYECMEHAAYLLEEVVSLEKLSIKTADQAVRRYAEAWYRPDYHYRKFVTAFRRKPAPVLQSLNEQVESVYINTWLPRLQRAWQEQLDKAGHWKFELVKNQRFFYQYEIKAQSARKLRYFVIISDALRYEAGWEFFKQVQRENRFQADMDYLLAALPSYTQLGMAALLPHRELSIEEGSDKALIDGKPTQGLQSRAKILETGTDLRTAAIMAEDLMQMNSKTDGRAFAKKYDLIYVYHNRIDKTGDDTTSESKVFEAVEEELAYLVKLCRKIANIGGNNMFLTADHGFLYQASLLAESDYLADRNSGTVWKKHRRFVVGENLEAGDGMVKYTSEQLGLSGKAEVAIPRGVNRLRVQGAGSRFVHGGSSLQEVVIPLVKVKVSKKKGGSNEYVKVDILRSSDRITTVNALITFVQTEPVSEDRLPTTLRARFLDPTGKEMSDVFEHTFDMAKGNDRQSMVKYTFTLRAQAAEQYRGQEVQLVLEQKIPDTEQWREYNTFRFQLLIQSDRDFDF